MGPTRPVHQRSRGGNGISDRTNPALAPATTAALAGATLLGAAGLAVYPLVGLAPQWRPLVFLGMVGVSGVTLAMAAAWPAAVGWGLSALVLQYGLSLLGRTGIDRNAVLYAASSVVTVELALAVIERRPASSPQAGITRFEIIRIVSLAALAATITALVLVVASMDLPHGQWLPPVAIGAATAALAVFVSLARRGST